ncbi:hypothetical protein psal_cds_1348 [Pandoravirus salinus]|uniref:F-box incomplete domain containing protein n=1 Tax=Pandoravirus salinus TaxID=1349410 RepID=S4W1Q7_9VIRU|nr:hypothetical protein psal_cds_1348 [Pandoravirus salinus]AGO85741.1 hypothetical protein psal_cds_1348 [Pandoravirus salinus]
MPRHRWLLLKKKRTCALVTLFWSLSRHPLLQSPNTSIFCTTTTTDTAHVQLGRSLCGPAEFFVDPFDWLPDEMLDKILTGKSERDGRTYLPIKWRWTAAAVSQRWRATVTRAASTEHVSVGHSTDDTYTWTKHLQMRRGYVASASVVRDLAASTHDVGAVVDLFKGSRVPPLFIAIAIAAADTGHAAEQARLLTDGLGVEEHESLVKAAARVGALRFVRHLIPRCRRWNLCDATVTATNKDHDQIVRALLEAQGHHIRASFIRSLWRTVGCAKAARTAKLLILWERDLKGKEPAWEHGMWWTSRELSEWMESAACVGWLGSLDFCDDHRLRYSPARLFAIAAQDGHHAFCREVADRHPLCVPNAD